MSRTHRIKMLGIAATCALGALAAPVSAAPDNPKAAANCSQVVGKQSANGTSAGGGPKEGISAPTNCDHFFGGAGGGGVGQP